MPPYLEFTKASGNLDFSERNRHVAVLCFVVGGSLLLHVGIFAALRRVAAKVPWMTEVDIVGGSQWPAFFLFPTLALQTTWRQHGFVTDAYMFDAVQTGLTVAVIVQCSWLSWKVVRLGFTAVMRRRRQGPGNSLKVITQFEVWRRFCSFLVVVGGIAGILSCFRSAREVTAGIMVSAGAAGFILALATKPIFTNIICSCQIALSQPITLDDDVTVDGEWAKVEEIKAQYIVLNAWDGRRVIQPLPRFTTKVFQNRSKTSTWKIGNVLFRFDPLILSHLPELRAHLTHILTSTEPAKDLWDGKVGSISATDFVGAGVVEVRVVVSAKTLPDTSSLRLLVRELLMAHVVEKFPSALVRRRGEVRIFHDAEDRWSRSM